MRSWQATATYFWVMSISMSYKVVFSATWWVRTKWSPSEPWQDRQGLQRTTLTRSQTPAPKKATSLYPLGTAKVDALVGPTADHLDVSVAWKRRREYMRSPLGLTGARILAPELHCKGLLRGVREGFPAVRCR